MLIFDRFFSMFTAFVNSLSRGACCVCLGVSLMTLTLESQAEAEFEGPRLTVDISQEEIDPSFYSLRALRAAGRQVFATPFNKADGHGDGPMDPSRPSLAGGRPTLQNNGTFLRFNGLDSQTCVECHSILSNRVVPPKIP